MFLSISTYFKEFAINLGNHLLQGFPSRTQICSLLLYIGIKNKVITLDHLSTVDLAIT